MIFIDSVLIMLSMVFAKEFVSIIEIMKGGNVMVSEHNDIMSRGLNRMAYNEEVRSDKLQIFATVACVASVIAAFFGGKARGRADVYRTMANGFATGQLRDFTTNDEGH